MSNIFFQISVSILKFPRRLKQTIAAISDAALCLIAFWFAFYLRVDEFISISSIQENRENIIFAALISILIAIPVFWLSGLYNTIFRYSGKSVVISISFAIIFYGLIYFSLITIFI